MVKIPTYETQTQAIAPISRTRPQLDSGASRVFDDLARFADAAGDAAMTISEKHTKIRQDTEFYNSIEKLQKGDPDNNQPGVNEYFITASQSNDFPNALGDFNNLSKTWMTTIAEGIDDDVVRQRFLIKGGEYITNNYLQAEKNIFVNARESYNTTIKEQINTEISNYINATNADDSLGAAMAHDAWFGKKDAAGNITAMSMGERLDDRGMLPPGITADQFEAQTEASLEAVFAADLIENNPGEFIRLDGEGFFDKIDASKLNPLRAKAKANLTAQTINRLITYYPINGDASFEDSQKLFEEATAGTFGGDEIFQSLYNTLDQEGKNLFQDAISQRHNQQKSEIQATRNNQQFREQESNKEMFMEAMQTINSTLSINDIENTQWIGVEGERMKQSLIDLVVKRESGELPSDGNLRMYDAIFDRVANKEITSLYDQFTLPGETEAKSIAERTGGPGGLGFNQFNTFASLISNRNNDEVVQNEQDFQRFLKAYEQQILGSPAMTQGNVKAQQRYFDFVLEMRAFFDKGIAEGKTATQLLSSPSPDFILKDILQNYIVGTDVLMREMLESFIPPEQADVVSTERQDWLDRAKEFNPNNLPYGEWITTPEYQEYKKLEPKLQAE